MMQSQSQLPKVSTRFGLAWLESRARFFSENESLGSALKTKILGSASFTSLVTIYIVCVVYARVHNASHIYCYCYCIWWSPFIPSRNLDEVFIYNHMALISLRSRSHVKASMVKTRADYLFIHNYMRSLLNIIVRPMLMVRTRFEPSLVN